MAINKDAIGEMVARVGCMAVLVAIVILIILVFL